MALLFPLAHPAVCSQTGPSSPLDPSQQPIRAQKQRSKVNEYIDIIESLVLTPTFVLLFSLCTVAECSQALRA